jgi:hypothetical protein
MPLVEVRIFSYEIRYLVLKLPQMPLQMRGHVIHFDPITRYSYLDNILFQTLLLPNELALAAMLLSCIRGKFVSDPIPTILNEIFRGLSQTLHVYASTVSEIRTSPFPTTSVSIHCLPIILSFDVTISTTKSHNLKHNCVQNTHRCSQVRQKFQSLVSKTIKFMDKAEFIRFQKG